MPRRQSRAVSLTALVVVSVVAALAAGTPGRGASTVPVALLLGEQSTTVARPGSTLRDALLGLLAGPTAAEQARGITTQVPNGTTLRGIRVKNGLATIDLGERFIAGTDPASLSARLVQVVLTATSITSVKRVRVLIKGGTPVGIFPGYVSRYPLTRADVLAPTEPKPIAPPESGAPPTQATRALQQRLADLGYLPANAVDGQFGEQTRFAVIAFQKWERLQRDGDVGPQTSAAIAKGKRPTPRTSGTGTRVEVLLDRQVALFIRNGRVERTLHVSTGMPGYDTPPGSFTVYRKEANSWSVPYKVWLLWASYFNGGIALHESLDMPVVNASHGCVRISHFDSKWLFEQVPNGTKVTVLSAS